MQFHLSVWLICQDVKVVESTPEDADLMAVCSSGQKLVLDRKLQILQRSHFF